MTDVSPTERTPASLGGNEYTVCAFYEGSVPAAQTVDIQCNKSTPVRGRYLFILRKGDRLHLQLCELEVYAWTSTGKSYKMYSFHIASRLHSRSTSAYPNDMCAQTVRATEHNARYLLDDLRLGEVEVYVGSIVFLRQLLHVFTNVVIRFHTCFLTPIIARFHM